MSETVIESENTTMGAKQGKPASPRVGSEKIEIKITNISQSSEAIENSINEVLDAPNPGENNSGGCEVKTENGSGDNLKNKAIIAGKQTDEKRFQGRVLWYNAKHGFGFITREDGSPNVFVHWTAITRRNPSKMFSSLNDGEEVEFDIIETKSGLRAFNVTGLDNKTVEGSPFVAYKNEYFKYFRRGGRSYKKDDRVKERKEERGEEGGGPRRGFRNNKAPINKKKNNAAAAAESSEESKSRSRSQLGGPKEKPKRIQNKEVKKGRKRIRNPILVASNKKPVETKV